MEPSKKKPTPEAIRQKARQLIQIQTGWAKFDLQVSADALADSGQIVYIARASRPDVPNDAGFTLWLDASGQALADKPYHRLASAKVDLASLRTRHARSFDPGTPITIDPRVNVLTLNPGDTFSETIYANIPAYPKRKVDVYLLADTTGSMGDALTQVQTNFSGSIAPALAATGHDIEYGVGNYKDFPADAYCYQHQQSITNNLTSVDTALTTWVASGGNDGPEGQLYALYQIAIDPTTIGWRPGAKRIVVWMGDWPGHEPICAAYTGLSVDLYLSDVIAALAGAQITVLAASVNTPGLDDDPAPSSTDYICTVGGSVGQASAISSATGGAVVSGLDSTTLVSSLISLIGTEMNEANTVQLVPTGATAPFIASIYPGSYGPIDLTVPNSLPFQVEFVGNIPCGPAAQVFYGTIDLVIDGEVVDQKQVEITVPPCDVKPDCPCDDWTSNADATLQTMANDLYFTIPATGSPCTGTLPGSGEGCTTLEIPNLAPCFLLKWGNGPRDQFETEDFEVVLLAICNPYKNVAFGCLELFNLRVVKADGSPVETLPDGTPTVMVVPGVRVDICEVAPCSCVYQELVIKSCGALEGGYKLLFDYCIEEVKIVCTTGAAEFPIELWRS